MQKPYMIGLSFITSIFGLAASALAQPCAGPDLRLSTTGLLPTSVGTLVADTASRDDLSVVLPAPPFPLRFNGQSFTSASVSTNGVMQLGPGVVDLAYFNTPLPASVFTGPVIMPFWDDLFTQGPGGGAGGGIFTNTVGTAPNRTFEVRWQGTQLTSPNDQIRFSIYFFENATVNPDFIIAYAPGVLELGRGSSATIGVQAGPLGPSSSASYNQASVFRGLNYRSACGGREFTYQGRLTSAGAAANGNFNLAFAYVNSQGQGLSSQISRPATPVTDGLFTVRLPLTVDASAGDVFVRISVNGTELSPDQPLGAAPVATLAVRSVDADTSRVALVANTATTAAALDRGVSLVEANSIVLNTGTPSAPNVLAFGVVGNLGSTAEFTDSIFFQRNNNAADTSELRLYVGDNPAPGANSDVFSIWTTNGTPNGGAERFRFQTDGVALKPGGGSWSVLSDPRAKHDVAPLAGTLDRLLNLRGYTFLYNDDRVASGVALPGKQIGLMADEVAGVFPDWVSTDAAGTRFVTERATTALMVEALRDLRAEKDAAAADAARNIEALRTENAAMRARLERLERAIADDKVK